MTEEKNKEDYNFGISQKAIIYNPQERSFLLVKSRYEYFVKHYGPWGLVGGTIHKQENIEDSFKREIKEEIGDVQYKIKDVVAYERLVNHLGISHLYLGILVYWVGGEIKLNEEHSEYKWVKAEEIEKSKEYKPCLKDFIRKAVRYVECENSLDNWKRTQADFENYKKNQSRRMEEFRKFTRSDFVMQILPVLDNFHASTDHVPVDQKNSPWVEGMMHIQKQLENVLKDNGVEEIPVKVGDEFDHNIMEAVKGDVNDTNEKSNDSDKVNKIVRKGYKIDEKVIRAAKVIVE